MLTDTRDVRACLPLDGGAVLAGTGGGLVLVRADGSARAAWTALDGLPETRVHALLRDGDRLWVGTEGGLAAARLEGESLVVERAIPMKPVRALALHGGELFAATWGGGLRRVDPEKGRLVAIGPSSERLAALAAFGGDLFAGGASGLFRLAGGKIEPIAGAPASIWALATRADRLWIGSLGGLFSFSRAAFRIESTADVRALAPSGDALLAGTFGRGALELGGPSEREIPGLPPGARFVQAASESAGARCLGAQGGLFLRRSADASWNEISLPELGSNDVSAIARDGDRLWIGTFDRGLSVLEGRRARRVSEPEIDDKINALAVERGSRRRVWVGTARGLDLLEPDASGLHVTRYDEADGLPSSDVHAVARLSTGGVLVGTARGAALVVDGRVTALGEKRGLPPGAVWAVAEGPRGLLLLGTSRGLLAGTLESRGVVARGAPQESADTAAEAKPWLQLSMATGDLRDDWVTALAVKGTTLYVGTYNAGVTALSLNDAGAVSAAHLGGGYVNLGALLVVGTRLYAGTMNGLLVRSLARSGDWREVPRAAPGRDVTGLVAVDGHLWTASRRGLARTSP